MNSIAVISISKDINFYSLLKGSLMKKFGICLIFVLLLALLIAGCNKPADDPSGKSTGAPTNAPTDAPAAEKLEIPSFEELLEANDLENIFKNHTNLYVNINAKSPIDEYNYTEEVIYVKGNEGLGFHKRLKDGVNAAYSYTSLIGNGFYYKDDIQAMSIMTEGEDSFFDYTLDFTSTPVGRGYLENGQIVYHTYRISEAEEILDIPASRYDYTLYFNKDTKLIEKIDYVEYNSDFDIETEYSSTVMYDVANVESKFDKTAYDTILSSENLINLEIIANYGTPEQASYSFVTSTDSQILASFNNVTYLLYTDPECQNLVANLGAYKGEKTLTLYAKILDIVE